MKRILFILLIVFIAFFYSSILVKGMVAEEYVVSLEKKDNIYSNKYWNDNYMSTAYYYLKLNDELVYCLEGNKLISESTYTINNNYLIDPTILSKLELISYYGYDYEGHQTTKYRMATQELIWENFNLDNVEWTTESNNNGDNIDIEEEKDVINDLINKHYVTPKFSIEPRIMRSIQRYYDENNVLDNYVVSEGNAYIDGNYLFVQLRNDNNNVVLTNKHHLDKETTIYSSNSSQKLIDFGFSPINIVKKTYNFPAITGSITINKESNVLFTGDAKTSGAIYEVYSSGALVDTVTTNDNGTAIINSLKSGKYQVIEKTPSYGYDLDENIYNISINTENTDLVITSIEPIISNNLEIKKVYYNNQYKKYIIEPDITFGIYYNNTLVKKITTNKEGIANIDLPIGTYVIKQETTFPGTYNADDQIIKISNFDQSITIINNQISANVQICNYDLETNALINGGIFNIININTNEKLKFNEKEEIHIEKNGCIAIPEPLYYGEYKLVQVKEPDGYTVNNEIINFNVTNNHLINLKYSNTIKRHNINIYKYGENKIPLENVSFNIYAKENIYDSANNIVYNKNELIENIETNDLGYGKSILLYPGNYYLKEIETNLEYELLDDVIDISIKKESLNVYIDNYKRIKKEIINTIPKTGTKNYFNNIGIILMVINIILLVKKKF